MPTKSKRKETRGARVSRRTVRTPQSRGVSNTGASAYGGTSRAAGLRRAREDVRNSDDEIMDSAVSGARKGADDREKARGNIRDPLPNRPDPESSPRTRE